MYSVVHLRSDTEQPGKERARLTCVRWPGSVEQDYLLDNIINPAATESVSCSLQVEMKYTHIPNDRMAPKKINRRRFAVHVK